MNFKKNIMKERKFAEDSDETLLKNLAFGSILILLLNAVLQLACLVGYIFPVQFRNKNASGRFRFFILTAEREVLTPHKHSTGQVLNLSLNFFPFSTYFKSFRTPFKCYHRFQWQRVLLFLCLYCFCRSS